KQVCRDKSAAEKHRDQQIKCQELFPYKLFTGKGVSQSHGHDYIKQRPAYRVEYRIPVADPDLGIFKDSIVTGKSDVFRPKHHRTIIDIGRIRERSDDNKI